MFDFNTDDGFQKYTTEVERYPVLDREGELALATAYRDGDKAAGDRLVCCSLRYVVKIAVGYRGYGFRLSELVAEGNVGLLQAVRRFEPERGLRFMTYAAYWVRAHVLSYILKHWSLVGVGTGPTQSKLFFCLHREKAKLLARMGQADTLTTQLAEKFNCSEDRIRRMEQRIDGRDVSLDARAHREGTITIMDTLTDASTNQEAAISREEVATIVRERITDALARLDAREQVIVKRRLLGGQKDTLSDLGRELGISRERVRQLEERVKTKLRRSLADLALEQTVPEAA